MIDPNSFTARRRPRIRAGATRKVTFELKSTLASLLRDEAAAQGLTQIMLLEMLIKRHCDPNRKSER
jgi:hypothetical protein